MENRDMNTPGRQGGRPNPNMMSSNLQRLADLDDYKVADGDPDVRGWSVRTSDGRKVGEVDSLIVDTDAMQVRFLDVELDRKELGIKDDRHVLVPLSGARLNDDKDDVTLSGMTAAQLVAMPPYRHGEPIAQDAALDHDTDRRQFYGNRGGSGQVQRLQLSEEELRVGKRAKSAGEARVHKSVKTRHVSEKVPLAHEELVIETRPIQPGTPARGDIAEGEVRIPLMAEEAVIDKRTVAKEEVVIRKKLVEEEKTVEADLRRERLDVDRATGQTGRQDDRGTRH